MAGAMTRRGALLGAATLRYSLWPLVLLLIPAAALAITTVVQVTRYRILRRRFEVNLPTIVAGFAVLMLHGFGHEPECACGCPAEPSSDAVMCGQCEQEAQAAAGMCRLCWSLPGTHDGLCRRCDATVRAEVERETTL